VTRSINVSAMICPTPRSSPVALAASACAFSWAYACTPCCIGTNAVRYTIRSGAGRTETHRSETAFAFRFTHARTSSWPASSLIRAISRFVPIRASCAREVGPQISSSIRARSSTERCDVSRTMSVARQDESTPVRRASNVCGICVTHTRAVPRNEPPACGLACIAAPT
jgi:hypothetical protein